MAKHILAIDQGTTGSTALIVSSEGETLGRATNEFRQHFPKLKSVRDPSAGPLKRA